MDNFAIKKLVVAELMQLSTAKGFVTFDDVLDLIVQHGLPLDDTDRISGHLLSNGCIIREHDKTHIATIVDIDDEECVRDRSDYTDVFDKILSLDSNLKSYIDCLRSVAPLEHMELKNIIHQAQDGNIYARERIISVYMRSVLRIALWATEKYSFSIDDTIQDGNVGLLVAIDKYDAIYGGPFVSYASMWIRQSILRAADIVNSIIYYPAHYKDRLFAVYGIYAVHDCDVCETRLICPNLINEIADSLCYSFQEASELLNHLVPMESVDEILDRDEDLFADRGEFVEQVLDGCNSNEIRLIMHSMLKTLTTREQDVLKLRFGFYDDEEKTLEEIGQLFNVTRERIRQIEAKAIRKLRHPSRSNKLKSFW